MPAASRLTIEGYRTRWEIVTVFIREWRWCLFGVGTDAGVRDMRLGDHVRGDQHEGIMVIADANNRRQNVSDHTWRATGYMDLHLNSGKPGVLAVERLGIIILRPTVSGMPVAERPAFASFVSLR